MTVQTKYYSIRQYAMKIMKITIRKRNNPTWRVCPSANVKIVNFPYKKVKFTKKFVYDSEFATLVQRNKKNCFMVILININFVC